MTSSAASRGLPLNSNERVMKKLFICALMMLSLSWVSKGDEQSVEAKKASVYSVSRDLVDIASSQVIGVDARDQERVSIVIYTRGALVRKKVQLDKGALTERPKFSEESDPLFGTSDTVLVYWNHTTRQNLRSLNKWQLGV